MGFVTYKFMEVGHSYLKYVFLGEVKKSASKWSKEGSDLERHEKLKVIRSFENVFSNFQSSKDIKFELNVNIKNNQLEKITTKLKIACNSVSLSDLYQRLCYLGFIANDIVKNKSVVYQFSNNELSCKLVFSLDKKALKKFSDKIDFEWDRCFSNFKEVRFPEEYNKDLEFFFI